jgi:hypothetical protein
MLNLIANTDNNNRILIKLTILNTLITSLVSTTSKYVSLKQTKIKYGVLKI